jgi:hypothetical protein
VICGIASSSGAIAQPARSDGKPNASAPATRSAANCCAACPRAGDDIGELRQPFEKNRKSQQGCRNREALSDINIPPIYPMLNTLVLRLSEWLVDEALRNLESTGLLKRTETARRSLDERIDMIDSARANLLEGVRAIDELKAEAERNRRNVADAAQKLAALEASKVSLEQKRQAIAEIIKSDVAAFQTVAGVPTPSMVRRERLIGFVIGVIASVVASGFVWLIVQAVEALKAR